jgi:hypothetical protein
MKGESVNGKRNVKDRQKDRERWTRKSFRVCADDVRC